MTSNDKQYGVGSLILFTILPFAGFIRACGRLKNHICGVVFVLFYGLFGYAHSFIDTRTDAYRKAYDFVHFGNHDIMWAWEEYLRGFAPDPYEHIFMAICRRVTVNPHIMLGLVGLIGAIFIYLTVLEILKWYKGKYTFWYYAMILLLVFAFSPLSIGGFRQYSSLGLVAYSIIRIIRDKRYVYFWGLVGCIFIHFASVLYIPVVAVACIVRMVPRKWLFYGALGAIVLGNVLESSGYQKIVSEAIGAAGFDNDAVKQKASVYSSEKAAKDFDKSLTTGIMKVNNLIKGCFTMLLLFVFRSKLKKAKYPPHVDRIWRAYLWFTTFGFLMVGFSVVGGRYLFPASTFGLILWFWFLSEYPDWRGLKQMIVLNYICSTLGFALQLYNIYCVVYNQLFWAPLPVIIQQAL